ncbi:MAG: hemolysin family protein [Sphingorhabdus sp.]|jgi:CBS domain containing-hemolysin-like protein|uniref:hemolysin family protein n=2 Tax=Sphingorhabdus sp. TaxID=1902408 RepID=UPI003BB04D18|nr:HlyC/CorC family transporter [Sphingomonadales bacterium]MBL0020914.1 HlyC/CorC family transporter [Sphingomonadales bacterium]
MSEGESSNGSKSRSDDGGESRIWQRVRALLFGRNHEPTLREQLEEKISEHEDDADDGGDVDDDGDLSANERIMLRNLLHFSEHRVDDVMVPRSDILGIEESASFDEAVAAFAEHGHSRLPVYRETLDNITGMIHVKDVFAVLAEGKEQPDSLEPFIRQPRFVPQSMGAMELLDEMRRTRTHLAIVIDEYSGTEGLVTIEDLVEEIVGEIEDEHDEEAEALFIEIEPGIWDADARAELDDLAEAIDPKLSEVDEDVDTLGGLAFVIAGNVPSPGTILMHPESGWRLEILEADERRVTRVRLHMPQVVGEAAG